MASCSSNVNIDELNGSSDFTTSWTAATSYDSRSLIYALSGISRLWGISIPSISLSGGAGFSIISGAFWSSAWLFINGDSTIFSVYFGELLFWISKFKSIPVAFLSDFGSEDDSSTFGGNALTDGTIGISSALDWLFLWLPDPTCVFLVEAAITSSPLCILGNGASLLASYVNLAFNLVAFLLFSSPPLVIVELFHYFLLDPLLGSASRRRLLSLSLAIPSLDELLLVELTLLTVCFGSFYDGGLFFTFSTFFSTLVVAAALAAGFSRSAPWVTNMFLLLSTILSTFSLLFCLRSEQIFWRPNV